MSVSIRRPADYWFPSSVRRLLGVLVSLFLSLWIALPSDFDVINPYGWPQFWEFIGASVRPDFSVEFLQLTWNAAWITFSYAVLGTFLSLMLGVWGACLTSDVIVETIAPNFSHNGLQRWGRVLLTIPRSLHEVIWGLLLINFIGLDPLVGILAIAIPYGAIVAKIFSEILDDTPRDALDSLLQSGSRPVSAILFGLFPRATLSLISYGFYRFECSLRSAAILGVIGAGGLGYQMMLSLESLRYQQLWTLFYAIFILNGLVDVLSAYCRYRLGAPKRFELKQSLQMTAHGNGLGSGRRGIQGLFGAIMVWGGLLAFAWFQLHPQVGKLWDAKTLSQLRHGVEGFSTFELNLDMMSRLPWLSLQTLAMSVIAIAIAASGAFLLSWFAAISWGKQAVTLNWLDRCRIFIAQSILLIMRAIPSPMWALVCLYLFRPGIMVGAIALGVHNMGVMGRLFAEDIENSDDRSCQTIKNAGNSPIFQVMYGLLPALTNRLVSYSFYRWEVCVRESFILALVGAGGLGLLLKEEISNFNTLHILLLLSIFCLLTVGIARIGRLIKI